MHPADSLAPRSATQAGRSARGTTRRSAIEYSQEVDVTAAAFDAVEGGEWGRRGSHAGTAFTVETLAIYLVHDIEHHLHDVTR